MKRLNLSFSKMVFVLLFLSFASMANVDIQLIDELNELYAVSIANNWNRTSDSLSDVIIKFKKNGDTKELIINLNKIDNFLAAQKVDLVKLNKYKLVRGSVYKSIRNLELKSTRPGTLIYKTKKTLVTPVISPKPISAYDEYVLWFIGGILILGTLILLKLRKSNHGINLNKAENKYFAIIYNDLIKDFGKSIAKRESFCVNSDESFVRFEILISESQMPNHLTKKVTENFGEIVLFSKLDSLGKICDRKLIITFLLMGPNS